MVEVHVGGDMKNYCGAAVERAMKIQEVLLQAMVTPDGLPLAYEVMAGNTSDKATLKGFLEKIERQYGKANRTWVMDRGIPTDESTLAGALETNTLQ